MDTFPFREFRVSADRIPLPSSAAAGNVEKIMHPFRFFVAAPPSPFARDSVLVFVVLPLFFRNLWIFIFFLLQVPRYCLVLLSCTSVEMPTLHTPPPPPPPPPPPHPTPPPPHHPRLELLFREWSPFREFLSDSNLSLLFGRERLSLSSSTSPLLWFPRPLGIFERKCRVFLTESRPFLNRKRFFFFPSCDTFS